jgi:hypothetical protein
MGENQEGPLVISSGGLNPSNRSDPGAEGGDLKFPNLARHWDPEGEQTPEVLEMLKEVDDQVVAELEEAGIKHEGLDFLRDIPAANDENHPETPPEEMEVRRSRGEVPTRWVGQLGPWKFRRAWYYWIASGPGIPPAQAVKLYEEQGHACRMDGGAPTDPREKNAGFAVNLYHVDTQNALNALAATIRGIMGEHGAEKTADEG